MVGKNEVDGLLYIDGKAWHELRVVDGKGFGARLLLRASSSPQLMKACKLGSGDAGVCLL